MPGWLTPRDDGGVLTLHIQPGARQTEVVGLHGDALKLRLAAPPVDGKANAALIDFLACALDIPKAQVTLIAGQTSRSKRVLVTGITTTQIEERLCPATKAA